MTETPAQAFKCNVCGYIQRGEAPDACPVCGAPKEAFEPFEGEEKADRPAATRWSCLNCNYIHTGDLPPDDCPVCGSPKDRFEPLEELAEKARAAGAPGKVVVVGAGIAGLSAVEALRDAAPDAEIVLVSKEPTLPYYRLNLTRYLADEIDKDHLPVHPAAWYDERRVRLMRGAEVSAIDLNAGVVKLRGADDEPFDKLVLTIGAHPFVPPFPGAHRQGMTAFRTVDDAQRILDAAKAGAPCVVVGGGLLGLETAGALARIGGDVTLLEGHAWLMPRQLNPRAGELLERRVIDVGVKVRKQARTAEILGDERVRGIELEDGATIPADLVVVATGVRPNSYLARMAGLDVSQGVIVDNHLASSHPNVLAAGDVAEHRGVTYGIWTASQAQGSIAGMNAAGLAAEFGGIPRSNTLKVLGLDLFSIGEIEPQDGSYQAIEEEADGQYCRFVFRDSFLVGAILLGDTALTTRIKKAVESREDFSQVLTKRPGVNDVIAHLRA